MSRYIIFGSGLAAEIEFSDGAGQTVNLLALRLQWFESTPTQASPRAILQVFEPFGGQLGISFPVIYSLHLIYSRSQITIGELERMRNNDQAPSSERTRGWTRPRLRGPSSREWTS